MNAEIGKLMDQLCNPDSEFSVSCDLTSSSVRQVGAPIDTALYHDLKTLAAFYRKDENCIAGELLTIALKEAFSMLSEEQREHLKVEQISFERQSAERHMEQQRYDPGCT